MVIAYSVDRNGESFYRFFRTFKKAKETLFGKSRRFWSLHKDEFNPKTNEFYELVVRSGYGRFILDDNPHEDFSIGYFDTVEELKRWADIKEPHSVCAWKEECGSMGWTGDYLTYKKRHIED